MREIKFRGKCKEDGEWIDGNLIINHNYCNNKIECCSIYSMDIVDGNGSYCGYDFVEIEPKTVGQYTGLKDKNGKEIFEGDILEYEFEDIGKQKAYVDWNGKYASFRLVVISEDFEYAPIESGIVIGNIYDNPELLEVEE